MELTEWAKLQEELLKAQLGVIRGYLRNEEPSGRERKAPQLKSQMSIVTDILSSAGMPLHVAEIMRQAEEQYGVNLDRESVVSAPFHSPYFAFFFLPHSCPTRRAP